MNRLTPAISPALLIWGVACLTALVLGVSADALWQIPLFLGATAGTFAMWRRFRWPDQWSRFLSFGAVVLIAASLNRLLYVGDVVLAGDRYGEWPFFSASPERAVFKAELVTVLGTFLTVVTWAWAGGAKYSPGMIFQAPMDVLKRMLTIIYGISLVGLAASSAFPSAADGLGQLLQSILSLGIAAALFLPLVTVHSGLPRVLIVAVLCSPFLYFALGTGMKENIILAVMPIAYISWLVSRKLVSRIALVGVAGLTVALLTMYVTQYREGVWQNNRQLTAGQAIAEFAETTRSRGALETARDGVGAFLSRSNASVSRGWTISLADEHGHEPGLVFAPLAYVFVPRTLWPEKPTIRQGWEYSGLVFGDAYISWSDSSTAAGLYPAFYLGFGWTAVVAGAVCIGLMMAGLLRLAWRLGGGLLVGLFGLSMLPYALRLDETWTVGALSGPIVAFSYVVAIFFLAHAISGFLGSATVRPRAMVESARRLRPTLGESRR